MKAAPDPTGIWTLPLPAHTLLFASPLFVDRFATQGIALKTALACSVVTPTMNTGMLNKNPSSTEAREMPQRAFSEVEYFEDYRVGDVFRTEPLVFDEEAMIEYARHRDPQPFHIDHVAAACGPFGGIIASGGHTFSACWGHLIKSGFLAGRAMGAAGVDELRWPRPVRPDDRITVEAEVIDIRSSGSRRDRGYVTFFIRARNQKDEVVMSFSVPQIIACRE